MHNVFESNYRFMANRSFAENNFSSTLISLTFVVLRSNFRPCLAVIFDHIYKYWTTDEYVPHVRHFRFGWNFAYNFEKCNHLFLSVEFSLFLSVFCLSICNPIKIYKTHFYNNAVFSFVWSKNDVKSLLEAVYASSRLAVIICYKNIWQPLHIKFHYKYL